MFCTPSLKPLFALLIYALTGAHLLLADHAEKMVGIWVSDDDRFARLEIRLVNGEARVQAYQRCADGYCPWSEANLRGVAQMGQQGESSLHYQARFHLASGQVRMTFLPRGSRLEVKVSAQTFDLEGSHQQDQLLTFHRSQASPQQAREQLPGGLITGMATGPAQSTASLFHVTLYGPDQPKRFLATQSLHQGYRFEGLRDGLYWLAIEPRAQTAVQAEVEWQLIRVEGNQPVSFDISLR